MKERKVWSQLLVLKLGRSLVTPTTTQLVTESVETESFFTLISSNCGSSSDTLTSRSSEYLDDVETSISIVQ